MRIIIIYYKIRTVVELENFGDYVDTVEKKTK
jgi:hypothetical protein